ncbi:winged-helix domain-containing protein [Iocasia frigidifontis]|uniref:winged-helix domain-containing protein n=1 Tax=Iocasia fonsfrigidae TaxID=2682810 RepID=UPI001E6133A7|nr:winged-helix domain-containing protein [Iocasia fonsfrigidae]
MKEVPDPTVKRLVQYYRYLDELESKDEEQVISSVMLGKGVGVFATQIRKRFIFRYWQFIF